MGKVYWRKAEALAAVRARGDVVVRVESPDEARGAVSHYEVAGSFEEIGSRWGGDATLHEIGRTHADPYPPLLRMYFDIDLPRAAWGELEGQEIQKRAVAGAWRAVLEWARKQGLESRAEFLVSCSSDFTEKVSLHIVCPGLVFRSHEALGRVVRTLRGSMEPWLERATDDVYKKNQSMRMQGFSKLGTKRQLRPVGLGWDLKDPISDLRASTMHDYAGAETMELDHHAPAPASVMLDETVSDDLLWAVAEAEGKLGAAPTGGAYLRGPVSVRGHSKLIELRRTQPSTCLICRRQHDNENAYVLEKNGVYRYHCHRAVGRPGVEVYRDAPKMAAWSAEVAEDKARDVRVLEGSVRAYTDSTPRGRLRYVQEELYERGAAAARRPVYSEASEFIVAEDPVRARSQQYM